MEEKYKLKRKWKEKMWAFFGFCPECGEFSGAYYYCKKHRDLRRGKRICKIDGCSNDLPKSTQFCDIHSHHRQNRNSCSVSFNFCKYCGGLFTAKRKTNYRCDKCWAPEIIEKKCAFHLCGKGFLTSNKVKTTCSRSCSTKLGDYLAKQKRRALRSSNKSFIENVQVGVLFKRDRGRCCICKKKLSINTHFLKPKAPTIDHIIPLSKSGDHSYKNTQLACRKCNLVKGNRPVIGGEQLLLFGI